MMTTMYTLWAVLRRNPDSALRTEYDHDDTDDLTARIAALPEAIALRGIYDTSGLKADADLMIWLHGPTAEGLQHALRELRRARLLRGLLPTWNVLGVHRDAEFNHSHVPSFIRGLPPKGWLCLYPFVRSHQWYLLPDEERRTLLAAHGRKGAAHTGVLTNTVAAFALGDYEWLLPLEADDPTELVDLMRDLRYTDARRYVVEETPFYTGRRIGPEEIADVIS